MLEHNDYVTLKQVLEVVMARGAIKADEAEIVGGLHSKLSNIVQELNSAMEATLETSPGDE